jgi:hypothetical protein
LREQNGCLTLVEAVQISSIAKSLAVDGELEAATAKESPFDVAGRLLTLMRHGEVPKTVWTPHLVSQFPSHSVFPNPHRLVLVSPVLGACVLMQS